MNSKLRHLISQFDSHHIDGLLISKDVNIRYLTDFPACESWLLATPKQTYYITDFRYILEAQKGLKGIVVKRYTKSVFETIAEVAVSAKIRHLGIDEQQVSVAFLKNLKTAAGRQFQLKPADGLVEKIREIKTKEELELIRKAIKLNLQAYQYIQSFLKAGLSERYVLERCERFVKTHEVTFSFPPIIASGPNSCFPHAKVTERKIKKKEAVLIDMGIEVKGYKSDLTRMFFLGKMPSLFINIYNNVEEAQRRAIAKIKSGIKASEADVAARNYLDNKKLGQYFGHSLGHGVGLDIHESPRLSSNNRSILREGMVVTVEPAVYLPNKFGIRIEDMVLVKNNGCEILSRCGWPVAPTV